MTGSYRTVGPLAYEGKPGCDDARCRRLFDPGDGPLGRCIGWHCSYCDEPCGPQGHNCDTAVTLLDAARRLHEEAS